MTKILRRPALMIVAALAALLIIGSLVSRGDDRRKLRFDQFEQRLAAGDVRTAVIGDRSGTIEGELANGDKYKVNYVREDAPRVVDDIRKAGVGTGGAGKAGVEVKVDHESDPLWWTLLQTLLPFVLLIGAFFFVMNTMQGGGSRVMQFGKAKAKRVSKDQPQVTFADVAGADEAVEELQEIKEFLEAPSKFTEMGAKIPKGVLLVGPPGTGKTLLARAVAGEAGVPFFSISGSDFVEMFVGVGASRVRDLFGQATSSAPAIIFVDEIDAVGRHRGAGLGGGHDEREQTLNQLLVEMDGFDTKAGVILIAATNRPDILDPALLRPGRFDRQIVVDRPDLDGRRAILNVHARGKPLAKGVEVEVLARRTPGFTGADLANLMNEAALLTARRGFREIGMPQLEEAVDRVIAGPERKSRIISDDEKRVIAYHEGGHALVGHVLPHADPIHKVSIIARGRALGWTLALPTEDKYLVTRSQLRDQLTMLMGGRTAEELIFHDPTTGAQNDIEQATKIARSMVTEYGMSDEIGPQQLGQSSGEVFLGREMGHQANYSQQVAGCIDSEVRRLIDEAHTEARDVLIENRATLDRLAKALIEKETLDTPEVMEIFADLPKRTPRLADSSQTRVPGPRRVRPASTASSAGPPAGQAGPRKT